MEKKQHPSYGMIRLSRSSIGGGGTALFGSSIMHNDVIRLSISKGIMEREGSEDRFFARESMKDQIVEVEMSYTQFAEAITSLNMGEGVPVTIIRINGDYVEKCPYSDRIKVMRKEINEATQDMVSELESRCEEIEKLLNEKRVLSKEDRSSIVSALKNVRKELRTNIPYLQEIFSEQMDKTVTEAKGEFEAYLQNKMNSIALAAMSEHIKLKEMQRNRDMIMGSEADGKFELVMLDDYPVLFTCDRMNRENIPPNLFCYDVRHDDECQGIACEVKPIVALNHWGTILSKVEIPMDEGSYYPEKDINYFGEYLTIEEYLQKDLSLLMQEENEMNMEM